MTLNFTGVSLWGVLAIVAVVVAVIAIIVLVVFVVKKSRTPNPPSEQIAAAARPDSGRVWVVVNPTKPEDYGAFRYRVDKICNTMTGAPAEWIETTVEDPGTGQALYALTHDPLVVLAAGGDGTVRAVAAGMAHSGCPMGLLPIGTGNLVARNLEMPLDLVSALEVAISGVNKIIDLAWLRVENAVEESLMPAEGALVRQAQERLGLQPEPDDVQPDDTEYAYLVIAGIGFDGETMANTSPQLKKRVGWSAYVLTALKSLNIERMKATLTLPPSNVVARAHRWQKAVPTSVRERITASQTIGSSKRHRIGIPDGEGLQMSAFRARTVLFANCGVLPFAVLAPEAKIDDGALDIIAIDTQAGLIGWVNLAAKVYGQSLGLPAFNTRHDLGQISFQQVPFARLDTNRAYPVQVDGDPIGTARTVFARNDPHALIIRVQGK